MAAVQAQLVAQGKRKEKARIAARARRSQEASIIMEMASELEISQEKLRRIDKATIVKLAIDYISAHEKLCNPDTQLDQPNDRQQFATSNSTGATKPERVPMQHMAMSEKSATSKPARVQQKIQPVATQISLRAAERNQDENQAHDEVDENVNETDYGNGLLLEDFSSGEHAKENSKKAGKHYQDSDSEEGERLEDAHKLKHQHIELDQELDHRHHHQTQQQLLQQHQTQRNQDKNQHQQQQLKHNSQQPKVKLERPPLYPMPKLTTASIFSPKTQDNANSYFLMIEAKDNGQAAFVLKPDTEIQDEDDLTHLAPQAGDISISFETDPLDGIPIDDLLST